MSTSKAADGGSMTGEVDRRRVLIGAAITVPIAAGGGALIYDSAQAPMEPSWRPAAPGFLGFLCDAVIPRTRTGSAGDAKVPDFVDMAMGHGMFGGDAGTIGNFDVALSAMVSGRWFMAASVAERLKALEALDKDTFSRQPPPPPVATSSHAPTTKGAGAAAAEPAPAEPEANRLWRIVKNAIVTGYYTTEIGGSKELHYQLVPGRFDPDVPVGSVPYLSNYWLENVF